jgi:ABC-type oligopeptide transport system ATPase subunit
MWRGNANGTLALDDVTFKVYKGEVFGICGESGSGKSTLARCINRLHAPGGDKIIFNGSDISYCPESK